MRMPPVDGIVAWRTWELRRVGRSIRLASYRGPLWPVRQALRAVCMLGGTGRRHQAPADGCRCGIYARLRPDDFRCRPATQEDLARPPLAGPGVFGSVVLSGSVLRYATGWRGERARPKGLVLVCPACWIVGRDLHAPTVVEESADYPAGLQPRCELRIRCTNPVSRRRRDGIKLATWPPPRTRQSAEFVAPCCSVAAGIGGGTRRGPHSHRSCSGSRRERVVAQYLGASSR